MKKFYKIPFLLSIILLFISSLTFTAYAFIMDPLDEEKVIYITFDDGPSKGPCTEILDILKSEGVNGTFFILGNEIKGNEDVLNRIYTEGHSIGLHSMTHERHNLYPDDTKFLNEMLKVREEIQKVTGYESNILRFPFGCNNNTYSLKKSLVELLHKNNLKIYDWTLDSKDGEFYNASPETFIKSSISNDKTITLLMHCGSVNKNSPKALRSIIKHYKDKGYIFKTIDNNTPEIYHFM